MPTYTRDDVGNLEFELDDAEFEIASDPDSTGSLRSGEFGDTDSEFESPDYGGGGGDYGRRFYELSLREFESETERDAEIDAVLDDMEREYFLGGWLKKGIGKLASAGKKAVGGLASTALKSGLLKPLAQAALSMVPGGSFALPALQSLGFLGGGGAAGGGAAGGGYGGQAGGGAANPFQAFGGIANAVQAPFAGQQLPWNNLAQLFQNSFGQLAARTEGEVTDPVKAMRLASDAFDAARNATHAVQRTGGGRQRVVHVRPGDVIVLKVVAG